MIRYDVLERSGCESDYAGSVWRVLLREVGIGMSDSR